MNQFIKVSSTLLLMLVALPANAQVTITHFHADLDATIVLPKTDPDHDQSTATATASFVLTQDAQDSDATTLSYEIQFNGLDLAPTDGIDLFDDITAIHFHDTTVCANAALCGDGMGGQLPGSTAGTMHVLNVFGAPRKDDADIIAFADEERLTGLWDSTDANDLMPAPSQSIADPAILDLLFDGKLAVMVHTKLVPSGEIGGFIRQVPEPSTCAMALIFAALATTKRRR